MEIEECPAIRARVQASQPGLPKPGKEGVAKSIEHAEKDEEV